LTSRAEQRSAKPSAAGTAFGQAQRCWNSVRPSPALLGPTGAGLDDLVYSENIGAYSNASSTWFNGFPPATVVHVNQ
jgi:hypothetical protein